MIEIADSLAVDHKGLLVQAAQALAQQQCLGTDLLRFKHMSIKQAAQPPSSSDGGDNTTGARIPGHHHPITVGQYLGTTGLLHEKLYQRMLLLLTLVFPGMADGLAYQIATGFPGIQQYRFQSPLLSQV